MVFVGYSAQDQVSLDINNALNKELTFKTVFRYRNLYPLAIEAVSQGLNVKGVVTDFFKFDDVRKAMDLSVSNKAEIVKAVFDVFFLPNFVSDKPLMNHMHILYHLF